jgi:hypothetical protein
MNHLVNYLKPWAERLWWAAFLSTLLALTIGLDVLVIALADRFLKIGTAYAFLLWHGLLAGVLLPLAFYLHWRYRQVYAETATSAPGARQQNSAAGPSQPQGAPILQPLSSRRPRRAKVLVLLRKPQSARNHTTVFNYAVATAATNGVKP